VCSASPVPTTSNALPRTLVRRFGWHLLAFCRK